MADCAVRSLLIVVSAPSLQLFGRVGKRQEPVGVQTFRAEPAIKCFDIGIVGGFSWTREAEHAAALVGPEVHVARDELAALVHANGLWIAGAAAHPVERRDHVLAAVAVADIEHRNMSREKVSTTVRTRSFLPVANWS